MFLIESFCGYRTTEPIWFRYFRGVFAIALILYSVMKFEKLNGPRVLSPTASHLDDLMFNISMCAGEISNDPKPMPPMTTFDCTNKINITTNNNCQGIQLNCLKYGKTISFNIDITASTNNNLSLSFESIFFDSEHKKRFLTLKYDKYDNDFHFLLSQDTFLSFTPVIINDGSDYEYKLELNTRLNQLPTRLEVNKIQIEFSFPSIILKFDNTYKSTDLVSDLGGFYGAIAGVFYLLFGMQKVEPWGLAQKYLLSYIPFRRSFTRKFAKKYVTSAGLPFVEKVEPPNKSEESIEKAEPSLKENLDFLKDRIQLLEILLKDYYLDDYLLKKVMVAAKKYDDDDTYDELKVPLV